MRIMMNSIHVLRAFRKVKQLSPAELAGILGIAETTLRSYENGNRVVSAETAIKIEGKLGITREQLRPDLFVRDFKKRKAA